MREENLSSDSRFFNLQPRIYLKAEKSTNSCSTSVYLYNANRKWHSCSTKWHVLVWSQAKINSLAVSHFAQFLSILINLPFINFLTETGYWKDVFSHLLQHYPHLIPFNVFLFIYLFLFSTTTTYFRVFAWTLHISWSFTWMSVDWWTVSCINQSSVCVKGAGISVFIVGEIILIFHWLNVLFPNSHCI